MDLHDLLSENPIIVMTYVLSLEDGNYYIGRSEFLNRRIAQHINNQGARWTKLHSVTGLVEVALGDKEVDLTQKYCKLYGREKVRGAHWCQVSTPPPVFPDEE